MLAFRSCLPVLMSGYFSSAAEGRADPQGDQRRPNSLPHTSRRRGDRDQAALGTERFAECTALELQPCNESARCSLASISTVLQAALQWFENVWNAQDTDEIEHLASEDLVMADTCCWREPFEGRERVRRVVEEFLGAYKGITYSVEHVMGAKDGSVVLVRWSAHAMHLGGFMGAPPSGRVQDIEGMTTFRLRAGKICRIECFREQLAHERPAVYAMDGV